jgi:hypothetical protein
MLLVQRNPAAARERSLLVFFGTNGGLSTTLRRLTRYLRVIGRVFLGQQLKFEAPSAKARTSAVHAIDA